MALSVRWVAVVVAAVGVVCAAGRGWADSTTTWGILSDDDVGTPAVLGPDLEAFRRVLVLGEAEFEALVTLHEAYADRLRSEGDEVRRFCTAIIEEAQIKQDSSLLSPAQERASAWRSRKHELDETFLEDVRVLLTAEQEGRWALVEREMRRLKRVAAGRLHGEGVDLIRLAAGMGIDAGTSERVAGVLERYSVDLDRALVRRDRRLEEGEEEGFQELIESDPARARSVYERCLEARREVRDVNWRYVGLLASEVGDEARAGRLRRTFFEQSFPTLTRATVAERYVEAALALGSLSEAQGAEIGRLLGAYEEGRDAIQRRQGEILMERELMLPAALSKDGEGPPRPGAPGIPLAEDDPLQELRVERWELDTRFRSRVEAVLSEEQRAAIPNLAGHAVFRLAGDWVRL